ncbi:MAG: DinB family protein [Cyclobacteriaceae bacterium]|jgi:hypothetical protein|nr:DinB family protein [Cyclobacteriaceae bacterium]
MNISHQEFLLQVEEQLEAQLAEVISVFQNLPEDRLLQPADNGGWSITECLEHLNTYAEFYLPRIDAALQKAPECPADQLFSFSFLGKYFINSMDPDQSRKKYKAMKRHRPAQVSNAYGIVSRFIQYLEDMLQLVRKARHKNWMKTSVATSISPWIKISAGDAIQFVLTHNRRHLVQARQLVASNAVETTNQRA